MKDKQFQVTEFRKDVRTCVRFLDDVLDVNVFALDDNKTASHSLRRLGLGVMGLADMLIKLGLRFDDDAGRSVIYTVMSALRDEAVAESERLGAERGVYPVYEQFKDQMLHAPRRNVAVLTVAPTGTTSMLMGVSSGIEPVFSPFIWRKIGSEYRALLHPLFIELMEQYEPHEQFAVDIEYKDPKLPTRIWAWDDVTQAISDNHGSVQGLEFVPEAIRAVFLCAHDIKPVDHVRMQGTVQRAFDDGGQFAANSLSKTVNLPNGATVHDVMDAYHEAYVTGCKGITVYRDGSRQFQPLSSSKSSAAEEVTQSGPAQVLRDHAADFMARVESMGGQALLSIAEDGSVQVGPLPEPAEPQTIIKDRAVFQRTGRLAGYTDHVKLTDPTTGQRRTFLITVNHNGAHPIEVIVISGRAGDESNADSEALGRVVSVALQHGVPAEALINTMRGINGGLYGSYNGRLVGSKADLLAVALDSFKLTPAPTHSDDRYGDAQAQLVDTAAAATAVTPAPAAAQGNVTKATPGQSVCPMCHGMTMIREEGCWKCLDAGCNYSKCG
ncbi:hypothetical protein J2Y00_001942 [Deinococcus soli (ex Cha et al. 2016)]|uniref:Uncharacterized protein n=2 Tax=Deinococcus soli (ex Cha et al. 2016) TaxID=1309411 RepID=A0ACC6KFY6_9DEIO|nr:hypothetical protein [Deinococcus soli (ex Cha et al. 2016)]MDR6329119.1 hypothetical protein [Deinococcus soli (ex Cha et al. 2016)]MDR6751392.1 hypothetical protein [Deinococcus soli (ex Cha et al. 2016)]